MKTTTRQKQQHNSYDNNKNNDKVKEMIATIKIIKLVKTVNIIFNKNAINSMEYNKIIDIIIITIKFLNESTITYYVILYDKVCNDIE